MKKYEEMTATEINDYINQDYVPQREVLLAKGVHELFDIGDYSVFSNYIDKLPEEKLREVIIELFLDGKSSREIAYYVPYTDRWVRYIIKEYKDSGGN